MSDLQEYVATLRCQTWNIWPEKSVVEVHDFRIEHDDSGPVPARLAIVSYANRDKPEVYKNEPTEIGPLVWDGAVPGLYWVRDTILKAPDDVINVALHHRNTYKGEVDIAINFKFPGEIPDSLHGAIRTNLSAVMSMLNLRLNDHLTQTAPIQVKHVMEGAGQFESGITIAVHNRKVLTPNSVSPILAEIAGALVGSESREKLGVALELYATHLLERQMRVRFLLLVMAMESLSKPLVKHESALRLLENWKQELNCEMKAQDRSSEELASLEALSRELNFRKEDSIRSQVRRLFVDMHGTDTTAGQKDARRALRVYDKRSKLVHDGFLPTGELKDLETEARELLEMLLISTMMLGSEKNVDVNTNVESDVMRAPAKSLHRAQEKSEARVRNEESSGISARQAMWMKALKIGAAIAALFLLAFFAFK